MAKVIMENIFTMSPTGKSEYCCNIVKVAEIKPVEGSDFWAIRISMDSQLS